MPKSCGHQPLGSLNKMCNSMLYENTPSVTHSQCKAGLHCRIPGTRAKQLIKGLKKYMDDKKRK